MLSCGDVCWADLPVGGRRPAVVITRDEAIPRLTSVLVVPVTRSLRGIGSEVVLGPEDGLLRESVASVDNIQLVRCSRLDPPFAHLSPWRMTEICEALAFTTGCEKWVAA